MLADKKFAKFSQEIGLASLGTNESDLMKLATVSDFFLSQFNPGDWISRKIFHIIGTQVSMYFKVMMDLFH